jgi:GMP synthase-like glutamine amidotransferase
MILIIDMNYQRNSLAYFEFVLPLVEIAQGIGRCQVKHYTEVSEADFVECSHVVLSGTPLKDHTTLSEPEKFSWLKNFSKPLLGICAGMQTIAIVFGIPLIHQVEIGMTTVLTTKENPLFEGNFRAYSLHCFSVSRELDEFEVLGQSELCVQAFRHRQQPTFGVLFHPEVRNKDILKRFLAL